MDFIQINMKKFQQKKKKNGQNVPSINVAKSQIKVIHEVKES